MLQVKITILDFIDLVNSRKLILNQNDLEKILDEIKIIPIQNGLTFSIKEEAVKEELIRIISIDSISLELI